MRRILFASLALAASLLFAPAYAHDHNGHNKDDDHKHKVVYPSLIPVPNGFQPEGVVSGRGHTAYVGSLKTGGIYAVDLITGDGEILVDSAENPAVGLAYDERSNYLFVAGGPNGTVTVYDSTDGQVKTVYTVAEPGTTFVNDGIVTRKAAYFSDSFAPVIYRIPLAKNGRLPKPEEVETIALSGDFEFIAGGFNGNGIESSWSGKVLYLVNSTTGHLYRVNPESGHSSQVMITNGDLVNGDGLLFYKHKLYVVKNFNNEIAELKLYSKGSKAKITRTITDPEFRIPTTVTGFGNALYAINARFDVAPPPFFGNPPADPDLEYNLVRVDLND
ncbi:SMP-30/gluconolactonase/LRE family protein [Kaarinaea lacus]